MNLMPPLYASIFSAILKFRDLHKWVFTFTGLKGETIRVRFIFITKNDCLVFRLLFLTCFVCSTLWARIANLRYLTEIFIVYPSDRLPSTSIVAFLSAGKSDQDLTLLSLRPPQANAS